MYAYPIMTGSLHSSTLRRRVRSSSLVCATFIGASLSRIAFRSISITLSVSRISLLVYTHTDTSLQTYRKTDRQTYVQTNRTLDRQTRQQTDIQIQTDRQTDRDTETDRLTDRQIRYTQTDSRYVDTRRQATLNLFLSIYSDLQAPIEANRNPEPKLEICTLIFDKIQFLVKRSNFKQKQLNCVNIITFLAYQLALKVLNCSACT